MRKILFIFAMIGVFVFSACQKDEELVPITCESYEELQNGVCVVIDEDAKLLNDALDNLDTLDDDTLTVAIHDLLDVYYITIEFDGNKSSFAIDDVKDYYINNNGAQEHYFKQGDDYQKEIIDVPESGNYSFFYDLSADMFTSFDGKFYMNIQELDVIEAFFESDFPSSTVQNFEMAINNEKISEIAFDLGIGEVIYHMVMNFTLIGETSITIPVVVE